MSEEKVAPSNPDVPKETPKDDGIKGRISDLVKERDEWKSKATEYETRQKQEVDQKAKEEGKFKDLLSERETALSKLENEHKQTQEKLSAYETVLKSQVDKSLEGVKDEKKRSVIQKALEGKALSDQAALVPELIEALGAPAGFGGTTPAGDPPPNDVEQKKAEFKTLYNKPKLTPEENRRMIALSKELGDVSRKEEEARRVKQVEIEMDNRTSNYFG